VVLTLGPSLDQQTVARKDEHRDRQVQKTLAMSVELLNRVEFPTGVDRRYNYLIRHEWFFLRPRLEAGFMIPVL
jgi:hypothetical protein